MRWFGDQSISRKITLMNLAVAVASLVIACIAFLTYDQATVRSALLGGLAAQADIVGSNSISALTFNDPDAAGTTLSALKRSMTVRAASIYTAKGTEFAAYSIEGEAIQNPPPLPVGEKDAHWFSANRVLVAHAIDFEGHRIGTVYIRASLELLRTRLYQYLKIIAAVFMLCLAGALIFSVGFRKELADPIVRLAVTAKQVAQDRNYSVRAGQVEGSDELSVLIEAFNEMLSQIQKSDSALQSERARLRAVIDNAPVGVLFAEATSGRIVFGNRQVEEILRYPTLATPDLNSNEEWVVFHADGRRTHLEEFPLYRAVHRGEVVRGEEHLVQRGDEKLVWVRSSAAPIRDHEGKIVGGVVAFNDIDEKKKAEQIVRQAYDRLAIAQTTAKMSDWEWDIPGDRVSLSASAEAQHKFAPGVFDGRFETWISSFHPEDRERFVALLRHAVDTGQTFEADYRVTKPDGSVCWLLSKGVVRYDVDHVATGVLGVSMDISTLKQAQEALLQSEKLAAAGRLAASISHEINNPLESVTNLLFIVANDPSLPEQTREFLRQAEQELDRVTHIATQTLRFYRQSTKPTCADVSALLDSVLALHRGRFKNMQVDVDRQYRTHAKLLCFEGELRQVFTNLVGNALDAMLGREGRLVLRVSGGSDPVTGKAGVRVSIGDTGTGIPRETAARIFEPFYSTKGNRGTGLGLWVTKEIAGKHRASIRLRSKIGCGTVFSVFFPFEGLAIADVKNGTAAAS